jgi:hypothetical protein
MRIERARADILGFGQFRSRKFLGLELAAKRFGGSSEYTLPRFGLKRNVPRAFGLISHDEMPPRLRRRLAAVARPQSKANEIVPLATLPALRVRFSAVVGVGLPSDEKRTSGDPRVSAGISAESGIPTAPTPRPRERQWIDFGEGGKPGRQCLKILSAWVNMNQNQYAVTATTMAENTNLARRSCVIDKRYRDIVKPQRNPPLNLTNQGYSAVRLVG